jgi:hypothetical protein
MGGRVFGSITASFRCWTQRTKDWLFDLGFTLTREFLQKRDLPVEPMLKWLGESGAGCDCEIMFNVAADWEEIVGYKPSEDVYTRCSSELSSSLRQSAGERIFLNMRHKTFKFKEGTVIASVSQITSYDMSAGVIKDTGQFTAFLVGGTAPGIKPMQVKDVENGSQRIFHSEAEAYEAALQLAIDLGYHPVT